MYSIKECDFWDMTLSEVNRYITAQVEVDKRNKRDKAYFDYTQSQLTALYISKYLFGNKFDASIFECYKPLFEKEYIDEQLQIKKDEASMARFIEFANQFNKRFKEDNAE